MEVSLLPDGRTAVSCVSVDLFQTEVANALDRGLTRPFFPFSCRLMDTLELDVGINTNDDVIVCEDKSHVAITVAPTPQLDILQPVLRLVLLLIALPYMLTLPSARPHASVIDIIVGR